MSSSVIEKIIADTIALYFPRALCIVEYSNESICNLSSDFSKVPDIFVWKKKLINRLKRLKKHYTNDLFLVNECPVSQLFGNQSLLDKHGPQIVNQRERIEKMVSIYGCSEMIDRVNRIYTHYGIHNRRHNLVNLMAYECAYTTSNKGIESFMKSLYKDFVKMLMDYDIFIVEFLKELESQMVNTIKDTLIRELPDECNDLEKVSLYYLDEDLSNNLSRFRALFLFFYRFYLSKYMPRRIYEEMMKDKRIPNYLWRTRSHKDNIYSIHAILRNVNINPPIAIVDHSSLNPIQHMMEIRDFIYNFLRGYPRHQYNDTQCIIPYLPVIYGFTLKYQYSAKNRAYRVNNVFFDESMIDSSIDRHILNDKNQPVSQRMAFGMPIAGSDISVDMIDLGTLSTINFSNYGAYKIKEIIKSYYAHDKNLIKLYKSNNVGSRAAQILEDMGYRDYRALTTSKLIPTIYRDITNHYGKFYLDAARLVRFWMVFGKSNRHIYHKIHRRFDRLVMSLLSKETLKDLKRLEMSRGLRMQPHIILPHPDVINISSTPIKSVSCYINNYKISRSDMDTRIQLFTSLSIFPDTPKKIVNLYGSHARYTSIDIGMEKSAQDFTQPLYHQYCCAFYYIDIEDLASGNFVTLDSIIPHTNCHIGSLFDRVSDEMMRLIYNVGIFGKHFNTENKVPKKDVMLIYHNICDTMLRETVRQHYSKDEELALTYLIHKRLVDKYITWYTEEIPYGDVIKSFKELQTLISYYAETPSNHIADHYVIQYATSSDESDGIYHAHHN